jgi:hypothetical protein
MQRFPVALAFTLALTLDTSAGTAGVGSAATAPPPLARPGATGHARGRVPVADSALGFRLGDQFGRVHDAAEYRGRPMILVGAARGGRAAGTAWVEVLRGLQVDSGAAAAVPVVAVADLRGVPRLLRRIVRGRFPDDRHRVVLLDWDGALARRLRFEADRCTIVLVGPDGHPGARTSPTAVDTAAARELLRQAAELGPAPVSGAPP